MSSHVDHEVAIIVPNWNGIEHLRDCLESLKKQTLTAHIIVVDNGSTDGSVLLLKHSYSEFELIEHTKNMGYAGGVNPGFRRAFKLGARYAAPFNNDAVADKNWLKILVKYLDDHPEVGIATPKLLNTNGSELDSTGDYYTNWGLPYPRGREESAIDHYDNEVAVFGASGGASVYRLSMLKEIGIFDEDFFAYYEDVDLSFRAQLAGWKIAYVAQAEVFHQIGATSGKMKGFTTYQTMKNLPLLYIKNVPGRYLWSIGWRLSVVRAMFFLRAISRGQGWSALKGGLKAVYFWPKKLAERQKIQQAKKVSDEYIWSIIIHDLPPQARALRHLRSSWWKLIKKAP